MAKDILKVIEEAIEQYRPGGEFEVTRGKQLAEKRGIAIPEMQAQLVGRGLTGTTVGAAIPGRFEREVAKPWETETAMLRSGRLMEAILAKAGIMERGEARDLEALLAREQMALQKQLAQQQITAQEYASQMSALSRAHAAKLAANAAKRGGAGAGAAGAGAPAPGVGVGGPTQHLGAYPSPFGGGLEDVGEWAGVWSGGKRVDQPMETERLPLGWAQGPWREPQQAQTQATAMGQAVQGYGKLAQDWMREPSASRI